MAVMQEQKITITLSWLVPNDCKLSGKPEILKPEDIDTVTDVIGGLLENSDVKYLLEVVTGE